MISRLHTDTVVGTVAQRPGYDAGMVFELTIEVAHAVGEEVAILIVSCNGMTHGGGWKEIGIAHHIETQLIA